MTAHPGLGGAAMIRFSYGADGERSIERFNVDMTVFTPDADR